MDRVLPYIVFGLFAVGTGFAVLQMRQTEDEEAKEDFDRLVEHLSRGFETRLAAYLQLAQSAAGLLNSGATVGQKEWQAYVEDLPATRSSAGFQGLGVAPREFLAAGGDRFPLTVQVPASEGNQRALGRNLGSDPVLRAAIDLARDRGEASFSGLVNLVADGRESQVGVMVLAPFYRGGRPESLAVRRDRLNGMVIVGLRADRLLDAVLEEDADVIGLRLVDASSGRQVSASATGSVAASPHFLRHREIASGGRIWRLEFFATPVFVDRIDRRHSFLLGLAGAIATFLATGLVLYVTAFRQRADQRALKNYQEFLLRILDTLPEPIVVKSADRRIIIVNQAYAEWVGVPADRIVGHLAHDFFPRDIADASVALDERILATGESQQTELVIADRRRQGELRNVIVRKMPGRGIRGEPLVVGIHQDVTEVRRSEARFRQLTELSSDWYWEQDAEFRFTMLSGRGRKGNLLPGDVVGKHRWDFPIDWSEAQWAEHKALLRAHRAFADLEYRLLVPDGEPQWFSISGEPIFNADGGFSGYRGVGKNITARHQVEEELRRHRDHLAELVEERTADLLKAKNTAEKASHVKSEFLANMSHELRTPLHAILSFARLGQDRLAESTADDATRNGHYFARILESGDRLLALVNNLLDLAKLEAGKMHYDFEPCDLIQIVRDAATEFEALAEERSLRLDLPAAEGRAQALIDPARFGQVLRNILFNAIKFSPDGACVHVRVAEDVLTMGRRAGDADKPVPAWRIEVIDEGPGIPEDEIETVFDKFIQSSKTRTGAGGTGLGLSICREIVLAHRGSILARNRREGGAVFEIRVPR